MENVFYCHHCQKEVLERDVAWPLDRYEYERDMVETELDKNGIPRCPTCRQEVQLLPGQVRNIYPESLGKKIERKIREEYDPPKYMTLADYTDKICLLCDQILGKIATIITQ